MGIDITASNSKPLTKKQFGDACEHLISAELGFAGRPNTIMPGGWPDYDIITSDGQRISVKGTDERDGGDKAWWKFGPDGWDWLALVKFHRSGERSIFLVPHDIAIKLSSGPDYDGDYRLRCNRPELQAWRNNFILEPYPADAKSLISDRLT
jgi:hypothetical protein